MRWDDRESDPAFLETIADARRQVRQGTTIGHADLKRELGIDIEGEALNLDQILDLLDRFQQRSTYAAVAGLLNANPRSIMKGRPQDAHHSWVVAKKTGQPTGYPQRLKHAEPGKRTHVIADPEELRSWLLDPK